MPKNPMENIAPAKEAEQPAKDPSDKPSEGIAPAKE
jgi:hypothetical protein